MRRVGIEGRAITKSFSYPKSKDDFIEKIETTARKEGVTFSDVVMEGLDDWWKEHGESKNPQTVIPLFETGLESAIPNLYEVIKHPEKLDKFYKLMTSKEDFKHLDKAVNILLQKHNKKDKEFL